MPVALLNPYCTVAELKHELKLKAADDAKADELAEAINLASRWIDEYVGRDFFKHDYSTTALQVDEHDGMVFGAEVFLPVRPLVSVSEVKVGETVLTADVDFVAKLTSGILVRLGAEWGISRPSAVLSVKCVAGYAQAATTDVPTGLPGHINLCARLVAAALSGYDRHEVVGLDGMKSDFVNRSIPATVFKILGRQGKVLV